MITNKLPAFGLRHSAFGTTTESRKPKAESVRGSRKPKAESRLRGFTLIELMVVIAIIGILVALLLPVVSKVREKSTKVKVAALIHDLDLACNSYRLENGQYPWTKPPDVPAKATAIVPEDVYAELRNDPVLSPRVNTSQDYLGEVSKTYRKDFVSGGKNRIKLVDAWGRDIHYLVKVDTLKPVIWSEGKNASTGDPDCTVPGSEVANAADGSNIDRTLYPADKFPVASYPTTYYWFGPSVGYRAYDSVGNF